MNILITGCAGFIGSHLTEKLIKDNNKVIGIDNLFTGSKSNMASFFDNPEFIFIEHDIIEPIKINENIDAIYHLACPAAPIHYQKDPIKTIATAFDGTRNMLQLALEKGAKILYTSTSEVYGDPTEHPQTENYWGNVNPIGERSCYNEGKRAAESLTVSFRKQHNLDAKIVRIFNTYGPRMAKDDGRVIPNFINQALAGKLLTIYGDGGQTRSFCYVSDLVGGLTKMMNKSDCFGPINLGNPQEITMKDVAEKIIKLTNSASKLQNIPLPSDDPKKRKPDITLAQSELNWEPFIGLEEGLKETINYFKKI